MVCIDDFTAAGRSFEDVVGGAGRVEGDCRGRGQGGRGCCGTEELSDLGSTMRDGLGSLRRLNRLASDCFGESRAEAQSRRRAWGFCSCASERGNGSSGDRARRKRRRSRSPWDDDGLGRADGVSSGAWKFA